MGERLGDGIWSIARSLPERSAQVARAEHAWIAVVRAGDAGGGP